jgi:hypothetical protein
VTGFTPGADMAVFLGFLLGLIGAALAWIFAEFFGRPFRQFFDLRREVNSSLVRFGNVRARAQVNGGGRVVSLNQLAPPEEERLMEAQATFRRLGGEMRAFAVAEYFPNRVVTWLGFDPDEIAKALIGYSNKIDTYGGDRDLFHNRIESLLRIRSD